MTLLVGDLYCDGRDFWSSLFLPEPRRPRRKRDGEPLSGATVNRHLAALSAVCKWAWKELRWLPSNPVLDVVQGS